MRLSSTLLVVAAALLCCAAVPSSLAARKAVLQVSVSLFLCVERRKVPVPSLSARVGL